MTRKILYLTFYFEPDIGPGAFRNTVLAKKLQGLLSAGDVLQVITTHPNRYASFRIQAQDREQLGRMTVHRIALPSHQSGMRDQAIAFLVYAYSVWRLTRGHSYDLIFASSSRLMTALLATQLSKARRAPVYLDIRDIFPETMQDVLRPSISRLVLPVLHKIEQYVVRSATTINLVSPAFSSYFEKIRRHNYRMYTNGIPEEFIGQDFTAGGDSTEKIVLYAGNMGDGQGLHCVIPRAAKMLGDNVRIRLVGDGSRRRELEEEIQRAGVRNVEILDPVPVHELRNLYATADCLLLHLNDCLAFERALPSKLFEYAATGKPILAGVSGLAAEFIRGNIQGSVVFSPCDAEGMVAAYKTLSQDHIDRREFIETYRRDNILKAMAEDVLCTLESD